MERKALYRRGYAAALRPTARARAVATLGVAWAVAWAIVWAIVWAIAGNTAPAGENVAAAALDGDNAAVVR